MRLLIISSVLWFLSLFVGGYAASTANLPPITEETSCLVIETLAKHDFVPEDFLLIYGMVSLGKWSNYKELLQTAWRAINGGTQEGVQVTVEYNEEWPVYVDDTKSYRVKVSSNVGKVIYKFVDSLTSTTITDAEGDNISGMAFNRQPDPDTLLLIPQIKSLLKHHKVMEAANFMESKEEGFGRKFYEALLVATRDNRHSELDITKEAQKNGIKISSRVTGVNFNVLLSDSLLAIYDDNLIVQYCFL
jgi:hypothetical protein